VLLGGLGSNILTGGGGIGTGDGRRDVFVFENIGINARGFDRIRDFEDRIDKIDLTGLGYGDFETILADTEQVGAHVQIDLSGGNLLQIENFTLAELTEGDFLF
jgi:Ca2+-binding RTX toxin-like protein